MVSQTNTPKEWRILAEGDMAVAEHLATTMNPIPTAAIAFHCQQSAEKYLKGAIVLFGEEPPYTHDLNKLCKIAINYRPLFASISSQCAIITHFAVQPRYDLGLSLSDDDMSLILAHAKSIRDFLKKEVSELFEEIENP
ncbi:MAG: HEPN domain-containing protein [Treponema sp.]|nr:HEPN domain-containing protein [Treponema sp.]